MSITKEVAHLRKKVLIARADVISLGFAISAVKKAADEDTYAEWTEFEAEVVADIEDIKRLLDATTHNGCL